MLLSRLVKCERVSLFMTDIDYFIDCQIVFLFLSQQEDMMLEVRLEKPSKPEKWDLPADISLKSALVRAKQEAQSKLDGTMAVTAGGTTALPDLSNTMNSTSLGQTKSRTVNMLAKPTPRHEMFLTAGTAVEMSAALHRALIDPTNKGKIDPT